MISSGWNRAFPISIKAGTYIISCQNQFGASSALGANVYLRDENDADIKTLAGNYTFGNSVFVGTATTITEAEAQKIKYVVFALRAGGTTYSNIDAGNLQLEVGSTATEYEEYQGDTISVSWQPEAGTVYGGTLDVVTGVLNVTDAEIASYNGETLPSTWISDRDVYAAGTTPTIGAQVVYKLATPHTYQLDPNEIYTLEGVNNVYADTGDVTVTYIAKSAKFSFGSPLHTYNYANLKLFGNTYIEHGKG